MQVVDIDGVRTFWADAGRPTLTARLIFRAGMTDRPLTESGWLHLLEHLSLFGRGGGALQVNGSVSLLHTMFDAFGPPDDVAGHLTAVASWLGAPDFDRLEAERGVLAAEARQRHGSVRSALAWRYGAQGPGIAGLGDLAILRATPDGLTALARDAFTRGNAALVLDGPPPATLSLGGLPDGGRVAIPPAVPCEDSLPGTYVDQAGLTPSGVVPRSVAATLLPPMIEAALHEEFRARAATSYAPWCGYEPVDRELALVTAGVDVHASVLATLIPTAMRLCDRLATDGPAADDLDNAIAARVQALQDPLATVGEAYEAAIRHLADEPATPTEERIEELRAVSREAVAQTAHDFRESLLVGVPGATTVDPVAPMIKQPVRARIAGRSSRHRDWPAARERLVVGADGVQIALPGAEVRNGIRFDEVAAVLVDGPTRALINRDGWPTYVDADQWHGGEAQVAVIDARVGPERLLVQAPGKHRAFTATPMLRRWWVAARTAFTGRTGSVVLMVALLLLIAILFLTFPVGAALTAGWFGVRWLRRRWSRRTRPAPAAKPPTLAS